MNSRERVRRTLTFTHPDRAPRDVWGPPGLRMFRGNQLQALLERYPTDFAGSDVTYGQSPRSHGAPGVVGTYTDAWGCTFTVGEPGVVGEVKSGPLADWASLAHWQPPYELLEGANFSRVNASCAATDRFVRAGTTVRPFERMQFLRGTENLMADLAWGVAEVYRLRDMLHEFYLRELSLWARTDVDAISFMDDWGSQNGLLISPQMWREFFKPLYADYCRIIRDAGKFVFFHSDGHIMEIIPDLIEVGVHSLNAQLFCMDIGELGRRFRGRITFLTEIDRQWVLPFGATADIRTAVRRVRAALDDGRGGVIAGCSWGNDVSRKNVETVFETWME